MIAARAAQGMGVSMFPIAFSIIRESFPPSRLAVGQSIFSSTFAGGAVVGIIVGAGIIQTYSWHATFFAIFPVAIAVGIVILRVIKDSRVEERHAESKSIDVRGAATLAATIVAFLVGLSFLENSKGADLTPVWFFVGSAVSLSLFIMVERKIAYPLVDLKLLMHRVLLPSNIILMLVGLCTFMVYQTIPILVQSPLPLGFGGDESTTAAVQLPFMIIWLVGMSTSGFLVNRIGNKRLAAAGTIICTIGFFAIFAFHADTFTTTVTLAIISIGLSFSFIGGFNVVLMSSPIQMTGISLGMTVLLNLIGQSVGPTIAGMYQQMHRQTVAGVSGSFPSADAYNLIFLTAAVMSLVSVVLALMLNKMKHTHTVNA
jgi:MFS family permease